MTTQLNIADTINSLVRFRSILHYSLETQRLYDYTEGYRSDMNSNLWGILMNPANFNYHIFRSLNERVSQIDSPPFSPIKEIWNRFFATIHCGNHKKIGKSYKEFSEAFKNANAISEDFRETDLIPIGGEGARWLPFNGICASEIASVQEQYVNFQRLLEYDFSQVIGFKRQKIVDQVNRDIKKLLSVPLGRELFDRIRAKMTPGSKLVIRLADRFSYLKVGTNDQNPDTHRIEYGLLPAYAYQEFPGGKKSVSNPPCILLAHELLHMLHMLEGTFHHLINPELDRLAETNEEERHVIRNAQCCPLHPIDHCNEENLRIQLGLQVRKVHIAGPSPDDPPDVVYRLATLAEAYSDALDALEAGVSPEVMVAVNNERASQPREAEAGEAREDKRQRV